MIGWPLTLLICAVCLAVGLTFRHKRLQLQQQRAIKLARIKWMFDELEDIYRYPTGHHEWDKEDEEKS